MATDHLKFGLWGGPKSGKTTYLASLYISALQATGRRRWTIEGNDMNSVAWLLEAANKLRRGSFESATTATTDLSFSLESSVNERGEKTTINLYAKDMPGGDFMFLHEEQHEANLQHMTESNGLILFLKGNATDWQMINLNMAAIRQRRESLGITSLNSKVAVCLAQYDEPEIFKQLVAKGLIEIKPYRGRLTPMVKNGRLAIMECIPDSRMIIQALEARFQSANIEYFALSSIGFFNQPDGRIDLKDCANVTETPQGRRIRSGIDLAPVNVWTPVAWLAGADVRS